MRRLAQIAQYAGIVAIVLTLGKFHAAVWAAETYDFSGSSRFAWSAALIGLFAVSAYGAGLPDVARSGRSIVFAAAGAAAAAALGISVAQLFVGDALLPRFVLFGSAALLVPWLSLCGALATGGEDRARDRDRVVVVGSWADASDLEQDLQASAERPAHIANVMSPFEARSRGMGDQPLVGVVERGHAAVVVLDREAQVDEGVVDQVASLHERGVRVRTLSLFYEQWLGKLPVAELERVSLMFDIGEVHRQSYGRIKRLVDVIVGLVGCLVLALLTPFVLIGNLIANRGPLIYTQERIGKGGEPFTILKFRTMAPRATGTVVDEWTRANDPRITKFGNLLRVSHLDELPQMFNILIGDLSIVGPRPEQPHYVEELSEKLPFYDLRHLVRPGLTGWAQVKYGYAGDESDALEKLQYDFYYLRHQGLALDGRIMVRTIRSVAGGDGR